jgi:hypothetical protein
MRIRIAGETVGARGITLMAVTAVAGLLLAAHGWSGRQHGVPTAGLSGTASTPAARTSSPAASAHPSAPTAASAPVSQGPSVPPTPTPGPKLSSQSYASYSFQVWPGAPSQAAKAAETGLVISVRKASNGITVAAAVAGHPLPAAKAYPTGAKVYVIEASMGDDSGNSDFNLGDDGLIVTDSQGRILQ